MLAYKFSCLIRFTYLQAANLREKGNSRGDPMVTALCWGTVSIMVQSWRVSGGGRQWSEWAPKTVTFSGTGPQKGRICREGPLWSTGGSPWLHGWGLCCPRVGPGHSGFHQVARGWTGSWNGTDADAYPGREWGRVTGRGGRAGRLCGDFTRPPPAPHVCTCSVPFLTKSSKETWSPQDSFLDELNLAEEWAACILHEL